MCPEDIELDIREENAKCYYSKFSEKQHSSFDLQEPGLLISSSYFWIEASQDGIGKFHCCDPSIVEIKCPFKGKDFDPKIGIQSRRRRFNSPTRQLANANSPTPTRQRQLLAGKKMKMEIFFLTKIIYIISKFRLAWQFQVQKLALLLPIQVQGYWLLR